jgi:hypothetical protein
VRIVFLDIDGVLNNSAWFASRKEDGNPLRDFDPKLVKRLNRITSKTQASIVVSSSWRISYDWPILLKMLCIVGIEAPIIGKTEDLWPSPRGEEISDWLSQNSVTAYVVLDDDVDAGFGHAANFVRSSDGLEDGHVARAVEILGS